MKLESLFLPFFVAGMLSAQTPPPAQHPMAAHHQANGQARLQKLTTDLNLTPDQQTQAKAIFQKSWEQAKALRPKLREERVAVLNAVRSDNEREIDRLIARSSQFNAQEREIHAKAMAKFYSILTPDQKTKMDQKLNAFMRPAGVHRG
jgi:Spy/CpxP family protein refolding chaperone